MRSIVDKFVEWADPQRAGSRARARHNLSVMASMLPGYKGGSDTRRRRQVLGGGAGREDTALATDYTNMIAAAMNLYRNDPMTRSIVDVVTTYMGESRPMATTGDKDFDGAATEYFNQHWWGRADVRKRPGVDFGMLQQLWTKFSWVGGDMLFLLFDGALLPYEGLQVRTPRDLVSDKSVINGVRIAKTAPHLITHYYLADNKAGVFAKMNEGFKRIRYNEAIFAPSKYWRPAMLRGVPELHAVIDALQDWDETNENVQGLIKLQSTLWTTERKGALGNMPGARFLDKEAASGTQVEYTPAEHGMRVKVNGDPERDFKVQRMDNPGSEHVPYMEFMGRTIAAGVGLPYEIVMHLYTNGSYTANRAARCDFAKFVMDRWAWRNKVLNQRVWNWVTARAMKAGDIPMAPIDDNGRSLWHKCTWTLPHFPQIDEGKEIGADIKQWGACSTSLADLAQEQGRTRTQLLDAHDEDISEMSRRAQELGVPLEQYAGELFKSRMEKQTAPGGDNA